MENVKPDICFSVSATGILGKRTPSSPNRSRTYDLPIASSDALTLSIRTGKIPELTKRGAL